MLRTDLKDKDIIQKIITRQLKEAVYDKAFSFLRGHMFLLSTQRYWQSPQSCLLSLKLARHTYEAEQLKAKQPLSC